MNSMPKKDPLIELWQTAPKPDTQHFLEDLERVKQMHRRTERTVFAMLCGVGVLLAVSEATGGFPTHGVLSATWIGGLTLGLAWRQRARCNRMNALEYDTLRLLRWMISRAKNDLILARCLYAGVPAGALVGGAAEKILNGTHARIAVVPADRILSYAGAVFLVVMVTSGIVLAGSRNRSFRDLQEKLRTVEESHEEGV